MRLDCKLKSCADGSYSGTVLSRCAELVAVYDLDRAYEAELLATMLARIIVTIPLAGMDYLRKMSLGGTLATGIAIEGESCR